MNTKITNSVAASSVSTKTANLVAASSMNTKTANSVAASSVNTKTANSVAASSVNNKTANSVAASSVNTKTANSVAASLELRIIKLRIMELRIMEMLIMMRHTILTHVKVMKWYDYEYLEEIVVRREDNILYKFMEDDFPRLNLLDIKDLLLLLVQKKLSNLEKDVIFDLNVALQMFTRRIVILKRVKDLQLGVKRHQNKLNLTKPETFRSDIINMTPYTAYKNPQGIIYLDKYKRNRLKRSYELYKFYDGTLISVTNVLHDIANNPRMEYLSKRK
nr:hypothetical protein [Tanacetum cinerariifolium]